MRCAVGEGPDGFLADVDCIVHQQLNHFIHQADIQTRLDLLLVASGDVGNWPTDFFSDGFLGVDDEAVEGGETAAVDGFLSLVVVTGQDVANGAHRSHTNRNRIVLQELHKAWTEVGVEEGCDVFWAAVG